MSNNNAREPKQLRVLHVMGLMNRGGAESRLMELFRENINNNDIRYDFCVFSEIVGDFEAEIIEAGGTILRCPSHRKPIAFARSFYKLLKENQYDVVDCNVLLFSGICLKIAKWAGIPKRVMHVHNTDDGRSNSFIRQVYRKRMVASILNNATDIIGVSTAVLKSWLGSDWANNPKVKVIFNGLDCRPFHVTPDPNWLNAEFDIPSDSKIVLHVGRFNRIKNHAKFVSIARNYLSSNPNTYFLLVGQGPLKAETKRLVETNNLEDKIKFVGLRKDVPAFMKSADALLFPSKWEGLPGVIQEAVAAGLPMVVSDLPGTREVLSVAGEAVAILPVDTDDTQWASALEDAVAMPRQDHWLDQIENSDFAIANALSNLHEVYRN